MSSHPGYRKHLSRQVLVREALELLDNEGLNALTMRNLADRLGVVPNSLYRHVKDKDDLLDGVLDEAVASVPLPAGHLGWDDGLVAMATAIRATMLKHPAITSLVVSRPSLGPASLAIGEYGFGVMLEAGFTPRLAERSLNLILTYTLGFVALEVPRVHQPVVTLKELEATYDQLPADLLPHTATVRPIPGRIIDEEQFSFGLTQIVAGVRASLAAEHV
ncbi:MAG: TetR/AcrR family transcriptional regulator C-terminal domain-containing protein [Actinomycetia bacterium]|nr:TetR/AcrR family transcriptional regulator C-terminal domain-containing protein [Actinomycetes bacterium]